MPYINIYATELAERVEYGNYVDARAEMALAGHRSTAISR